MPSSIRHGFMPGFVNYKKGCTRLTAASDKVYQLLIHGRWFSPGTSASSTTKTGRHDIAEILLKVALNTINQIKSYIVSGLLQGGVSQEDIGVIAPYRHQVRYIQDSLTDHSVEVNTVDQFQGRDKDVIIISFTRSFTEKSSEQNKVLCLYISNLHNKTRYCDCILVTSITKQGIVLVY